MNRPIRSLLPLVALWLAPSACATDLAYVKCAVNQDRVWVYESLSSFDVEARLRCGAPVEILSRVKGYVKVRTESGVEGFVLESAFPDLPALPVESEKPLASAVAQPVAVSRPAPAASAPALRAGAAKPATPVVGPAKPLASAAVAPEPAAVSSAPAPIPVKVSAPVKPAPPAAAPVSAPSSPAKPATTVVKKPEAAPANPPAAASTARGAVPAPAAPVAPARPAVETVSTSRRDGATIVPATALPSAPLEESDEYPDTQPENESADPACRVYFAAYGLAPSQYKWLAENRRKEFSGICPAPDLGHVDYVVLFTHDSDSYTFAMPTPVHVDHNGFSDFSPLTTVDTALVTASEVERARYEFVWVFRVTRGAFDPAKFSARRKPQFTTSVKGSRASSRAIEDAFNFVETQGGDR
jgi:hypothetical protein